MSQTQVLLTKQWSDWKAGDVVTLESEKAKRVIAKGYGEKYKPGRKDPAVETADAVLSVERAVVDPAESAKPDIPADSDAAASQAGSKKKK